MRTLMTKGTGLVLISVVMLFGLTLSHDLSWGADHTIPYPELMPVILWTRGCSPTSASMVLGYYDNYVPGYYTQWNGYGRLIDYWMDLSEYVDGHTGKIMNVPNILDQLRVYMSTDADGKTYSLNIGAAIRQLTADKGYYFDSNDCQSKSGDNNFCWEDITWEINQGRPFVWSIAPDLNDDLNAHSLAAWGYRDDGYVITYNTWSVGRNDWFYKYYNNDGYTTARQRVTSAVPGVAQGLNQIYIDPLPRSWWTGGEICTINWHQWGTLITNVDLRYSLDGGHTWEYMDQNVPSAPGLNSYDWTVPNIYSSSVRVMVTGFDPSRNYSYYGYIACDGTKDSVVLIFPDVTPPSGSLLINGGATYTTSPAVMVTVSATDYGSGIDQMCFSGDISGGACQPYAPTKSLTLNGGDGAKTVIFTFIDRAGNASLLARASIILDTTPPSGSITINNDDAYTRSTSVKLQLSASDANSVPQMCISSTTSCSSWEPFATSKAWTLQSGDGTKTVYAMFKDGAGNVSTFYSHSIVLDTTAPAGSVKINGGAAFTNSPSVTLTLYASDATEMCITDNPRLTCLYFWEPYAATKSVTWSGGDGTHTVYVTFRDAAGNVSPTYSDSIILDTGAPTGSVVINGGAAFTNSPSVNLTLSASDASGITEMCIRNDRRLSCALLWEPYAATKSVTWASGGDGTRTVYVTFRDAAGNVSPTYSDSITLDTKVPTGSVKINGGAKYTNSPSVNLKLSASDTSGVTEMCITDNPRLTCAYFWEPYATTKSVTWSSGGDGAKTVYVRFSDAAGNVSPTYSDSITLDTTPPTDGTLSAVPGNGQVSLKWSRSSDAGSGVATYTLLVSTADHPAFIRNATTQIYSGTGTSYVHKGLTNGTMYFYRVCATDKEGNTSTGTTASAIAGTSGQGIPKISVTPTAYDFGSVNVKKSKQASFVAQNSGKANLSITSTIAGTDASMFTITSGGGNKTITPGKSLTVNVAFKPTSEGEKTAKLEITSNDPFTPTTHIALSGTGQ